MASFLEKIIGNETNRTLKRLQPIVDTINSLETAISALSSEELKAKTKEFKDRLQKGETLDQILPEAFAVVREAGKRTRNERHFDVQLMGGIILHEGGIAEMRTGEGKTLVATLPAYLNSLEGRGVHIVTVNDYLSRRDAVWMGEIYDVLGVSVGVINHEESFVYDATPIEKDSLRDEVGSFKVITEFLRKVTRRDAYAADITYGTNNEFGFDYLRDNIEYIEKSLRQREHNFAIVDEIDSILIDEARTPLIISAPASESGDLYRQFAEIANKLDTGEHYTVDEKFKTISLTDSGIAKVEEILGIENMYTDKGIAFVHHLETAVRAAALYYKDKDYVVQDNEVVIVDEFTGRLQPGRRWSEGLHQAIEAKEHVTIQKESKTFASITFQNYFRLYKKLSGMTGTADTSSEEFNKVYGLQVIQVPTNKKAVRKDSNDLIFQTEAGKFKAIAREVKERYMKGQPVLIGTVSIQKNELLSEYLKAEGIEHEVLNAKNHSREGEIIAQAGKKKAVTIATNMAGRGVDVKLGGNPSTPVEHDEVAELGGLFVLGTERHDARRIDNQLRGRSGRQGDHGETQFFVSMEDHLMRVFGGDNMKSMMGKLGMKDDEPIENRLITRSLESAQEKIEGFNFDARKHVLEFDDVLNFQRKIFYARRKNILLGVDEKVIEYVNEILGTITVEESEIKNLKESIEEKLHGVTPEFITALRQTILQTMDMFWIEHLEVMDYMRSSVNLRAYGQRDPLVEYKREGLRLFKDMEYSISQEVVKRIPYIQETIVIAPAVKVTEKFEGDDVVGNSGTISVTAVNNRVSQAVGQAVGQTFSSQSTTISSIAVHNPTGEKVGRNDPCFCGSGKKYKKCGELNTEEHQEKMLGKQ